MDTLTKAMEGQHDVDLKNYLEALSQDPDEYVNRLGEAITLMRKKNSTEKFRIQCVFCPTLCRTAPWSLSGSLH